MQCQTTQSSGLYRLKPTHRAECPRRLIRLVSYVCVGYDKLFLVILLKFIYRTLIRFYIQPMFI